MYILYNKWYSSSNKDAMIIIFLFLKCLPFLRNWIAIFRNLIIESEIKHNLQFYCYTAVPTNSCAMFVLELPRWGLLVWHFCWSLVIYVIFIVQHIFDEIHLYTATFKWTNGDVIELCIKIVAALFCFSSPLIHRSN